MNIVVCYNVSFYVLCSCLQNAFRVVGYVGSTLRSVGQLQSTKILAKQISDQHLGWVLRNIRGELHCQHRGSDCIVTLPERSSGLQRPKCQYVRSDDARHTIE